MCELDQILSEREIEVAFLVFHGYGNKEISNKLQITIRTTQSHILHILTKFNIHNSRGIPKKLIQHEYINLCNIPKEDEELKFDYTIRRLNN